MRQSKLFSKTSKTAPADEVSKNAQLLIRAGFIHKEMAGVYSFLPLGLKVIGKIEKIISDEMETYGGVRMKNATLQNKEKWEATNRWDDEIVDNWFKTELKNGTKLGLSFTHEEAITNLMKSYISSYKDLPAYPFDIMNVFRNETRAKSGIMRGREFYWKALYSFSKSEKEHQEFYEKMKEAYKNIFDKVGLGEKTFITFASGGTFSKYSHEFQTVSEAGEDLIYIDDEKNLALNKEVLNDEVLTELNLEREKLREEKAIEVGNIFTLGYKFSEALNLKFKDKDESEKFVFMGSYGIGISRLMGTIVEELSDEKGIVWPEAVAPFQLHLINIGEEEKAEELYNQLQEKGIEVLWDDRDKRPGEKFGDADLIGIPNRVVISPKSLETGGVEFKKRNEEKGEMISVEELFDRLKK